MTQTAEADLPIDSLNIPGRESYIFNQSPFLRPI